MTINCSFNWPEISCISGPCIRPGGALLTERALEICTLFPGSHIADIGCGAGGTLEHLEQSGGHRLVGLDSSETLLGEAVSRLGSARLVQGRAETLPFKKDSFDALFCECVLSILDDRIAALVEFARVLKQDGFLVLSDLFRRGSSGQGMFDGESQKLRTQGLLAQDDLIGHLTKNGFTILLWEEHDRLLKEFAARMILAGNPLPDIWGCGPGQKGKKSDRAALSYFLLVARKQGPGHGGYGSGA